MKSGANRSNRPEGRARLGIVVLALALASVVGVGLPPTKVAACQFDLGFNALRDLIPSVVGDCLADAQYDPATGDAVRTTTGAHGRGGLLVWRRSDNQIAYTDGFSTWINGPDGLRVRRNLERFAWENDPRGAVSASPELLLGVNAHPLQNIYAIHPADAVLDRASSIGASVVRIDIHWDWLEWDGPSADQWDPEQVQRLDTFLDEASRRHLRVLAVVMDTPCWASSDPARQCGGNVDYNWRYPPADPRTFAAFLRRLVEHAHGRVQYWEIWNEPNLPQFWPHPDPAAYTRLLQAAYPAIKGADPAAVVLAGALAPIERGASGDDTLSFIDGMYAAGALGSFDALSFHPYNAGQSPTVSLPNLPTHSFVQSVPEVRAEMLRAGDTRPMWITESGWPNSPSCDDCPALNSFVSPDDQATYLRQEVQIARRWDYVAGLVWYELFDRGPVDSLSTEDHFGLFFRDLSPKPASETFRQLTESSSGSSQPQLRHMENSF